MTRTVIEERPMPFREVDVFSRLMADRIIFLGTGVDDYIANIIQAQLLFLESTDPGKDIQIYINSPGGSVYAGLGIYDTMQYIRPDVATICTGMAASMGAVFSGGAAGKRTGLPQPRDDSPASRAARAAKLPTSKSPRAKSKASRKSSTTSSRRTADRPTTRFGKTATGTTG